ETAEAYHSAADVQRDAGEHELAEQNYLRAVELFRAVDGPYTHRAIEPLIGLGDNYQAAGQHLNAVTVYNEARTISRRAYGLLNEGQVPILDRITEAFQALGQYVEADEQQRTILHLAERNYPEGSLEHLEALYRYAGWLRSSGRFHDERLQYARAMRLIREMHGKDSTLLVRPLREVANSFREQRLPDNQGVSSLRTALELLDKDTNANSLLRAEVLRDMGDWEIAFSRVQPDLDTYVRAWTLLGDVENGGELRREWFGKRLHSVYMEPINDQGLSRAPEAVPGYVIVTFDVDRFGRTSNVRVARSEPRGYKDDAVVRAVQRWRFRPLIENGEIVPREDVPLRFNYRYLPESLSRGEDADAGWPAFRLAGAVPHRGKPVSSPFIGETNGQQDHLVRRRSDGRRAAGSRARRLARSERRRAPRALRLRRRSPFGRNPRSRARGAPRTSSRPRATPFRRRDRDHRRREVGSP